MHWLQGVVLIGLDQIEGRLGSLLVDLLDSCPSPLDGNGCSLGESIRLQCAHYGVIVYNDCYLRKITLKILSLYRGLLGEAGDAPSSLRALLNELTRI